MKQLLFLQGIKGYVDTDIANMINPQLLFANKITIFVMYPRADSRFAPSQWGTFVRMSLTGWELA